MVRATLVAAALGYGLVSAASAATLKFAANMTANEENPPTNSKGTGAATATLDTQTHKFDYNVTWQGLASPVIAAHFHGPAQPGRNAGVQIPIDGANPKSPVAGSATLTDEQQQQVVSNMWYVNVHTQNHPDGAIRGQLKAFTP